MLNKPPLQRPAIFSSSLKSVGSSMENEHLLCPDPVASVLSANHNLGEGMRARHDKTFKPLTSMDKLDR